MTDQLVANSADLAEVADDWIGRLQCLLNAGDADGVAGLFVEECGWRDLVAIDWTISTVRHRSGITDLLRRRLDRVGPVAVEREPDRQPARSVRAGTECIECFLQVRTRFGSGRGVVRLVPDPERAGGYLAWTLSTALQTLTGFEEINGHRRPSGYECELEVPGSNWLDYRIRSAAYTDHDPDVLIVGGGQAGLGLAARLVQLQVDSLVIDKWPRIGDNWRQRYHTLHLHNETWTCHLPYMKFPDTWPTYLPKDKLANWFEFYVDSMDINYWVCTEFVSGEYSEQDGRWTVVVRRDGIERTMRPRHVVMATGVSGIPFIPEIDGLATFKGRVLHTSRFTGGSELAGMNVAIVGTGTSAHDVAQDLFTHGANVTMLQRGSTTVVDLEPASILPAKIYEEGWPLEDVDLLGVSTPYPFSLKSSQLMTAQMRELDRKLIADLERAGFSTDYGDDDAGLLTKYLKRGGGYYINVGCSNLIIEGKVGIRQWDDIAEFTATGIRFTDGTSLELDAIVLATGYLPMQAGVERHFGVEVAQQVGPVWGLSEVGELNNTWRRTPHPGLWFGAGSLMHCRVLSLYLALQIKAALEGLIEPERLR